MGTVNIPIEEYKALIDEIRILKNQDLLVKVNQVIDLMYESKYGLYLGDFTDDLTSVTIDELSEWHSKGDVWNEV
ncbi:MAG: hypothetical protein M9949_11025 [Candidatus Kapabacteria bacterium]|nr:hypothetical protein [Candidatus Kapabacteria bacterium]